MHFSSLIRVHTPRWLAAMFKISSFASWHMASGSFMILLCDKLRTLKKERIIQDRLSLPVNTIL